MRTRFSSAFVAILMAMFMFNCPAVRAQEASSKPQIFVCGDSTSKFSGSEMPGNYTGKDSKGMTCVGWGTLIPEFFDPDKATIVNVGQAGASSLSYYNGTWPHVLPRINKGDYMLLVFGINDGTTPDGTGDEVIQRPVRGRGRGPASGPAVGRTGRPGGAPDAQANGTTQPAPQMQSIHTYGWYMSKMATDATEKGAHVYLLTVTTRNMWTNTNPNVTFKDATPTGPLPADYDPKGDHIERGTGKGVYTQWTKDVAAKLHLPVFDLTNSCADLYEKMGREEVNKLYSDHNHTYPAGAETVASVITSGLKAFKNSPFTLMLSDKGKALPTADAKYAVDNQP